MKKYNGSLYIAWGITIYLIAYTIVIGLKIASLCDISVSALVILGLVPFIVVLAIISIIYAMAVRGR